MWSDCSSTSPTLMPLGTSKNTPTAARTANIICRQQYISRLPMSCFEVKVKFTFVYCHVSHGFVIIQDKVAMHVCILVLSTVTYVPRAALNTAVLVDIVLCVSSTMLVRDCWDGRTCWQQLTRPPTSSLVRLGFNRSSERGIRVRYPLTGYCFAGEPRTCSAHHARSLLTGDCR